LHRLTPLALVLSCSVCFTLFRRAPGPGLRPRLTPQWVCIVYYVQIDIHGLFLSLCSIVIAPTRPRFVRACAHSRRLVVAEQVGGSCMRRSKHAPRSQPCVGLASPIPLGGWTCSPFYSHHNPNNLSVIRRREAFIRRWPLKRAFPTAAEYWVLLGT